jgi:hypothetical protein
MKLRRVLLRMSLLGAGMLPLALAAATYKWIDENGVVNYGNTPPAAARQVRQLDEEAGRVSTIPAVPKAQIERESDRLLRARVTRLEEELEDLRRARAAATVPMPAYDRTTRTRPGRDLRTRLRRSAPPAAVRVAHRRCTRRCAAV